MRQYTNLAWPDAPYRTQRQLDRRPGPLLAAFAAWPPITGGRLAAVANHPR